MSDGMYLSEKIEDEPRFQFCESSTKFARVAVAISAVALIVHIVAIACPNWILATMREEDATHAGLWVECNHIGIFTTNNHWLCQSYVASHHVDSIPVFLKATQALETLGLLFLFGIVFLLVLYTVLPKLRGRKLASFLAMALSLICGTCVIAGAIVYACGYPRVQDILGLHKWRFAYAFVFEFIVGILCYCLTLLIVLDLRQSALISTLRFF